MTLMISTQLYELAHARSGDKGNRLNIALVCRQRQFYPVLSEQLTSDVVAEIFGARRPSHVERYDLPRLAAFNFVLDDVLDGGINGSLGLDGHGKTLSFLLLAATVQVPKTLLAAAAAERPASIPTSTRHPEPMGDNR